MPEESHIKQLFSSITSAVDDDFEDCEPLKVGASKIKIPPSYLVLPIIIIVLIVSMLTSVIAHYVITFFCLLYPAYMSFKVLGIIFRLLARNKRNSAKNGWLTGLSSHLPRSLTRFCKQFFSLCLLSILLKLFSSFGCSTQGQMVPALFMKSSWSPT